MNAPFGMDMGQWRSNMGQLRDQFGELATNAQNRQAPTMQAASMNAASMNGAMMDPAQQEQFRQMQMQNAQGLMAQAQGQGGPSPAELQMRAGLDRQVSAANAMAASQRGVSPGMAMKMAMDAQNQAGLQTNQNAAVLRAQEQQQAQNALGQILTGARGQDIGFAAQQAGFDQDTAKTNAAFAQGANQANAGFVQGANNANLGAQLTQTGMNDAQTRFGMQGMMGVDSAGMNYDLSRRGLSVEQDRMQHEKDLAQMGYQNQRDFYDHTFWRELGRDAVGGLISAGGQAVGAAAMSDERLKKNIKDADAAIDAFLRQTGAHQYEYKDKKHGAGRYVSPMAQELEKTDIGKSMVIETPEGKMVDYGRGLGAILAAQSRLARRLDGLERGAA